MRALLVNVTIEVRDKPGPEAEAMDEEEEDLLGLYCGPERADFLSGAASGQLPAKVYLYQRNLEDSVGSLSQLRKEIRLTLRHELAHHFGFDDDDSSASGPKAHNGVTQASP